MSTRRERLRYRFDTFMAKGGSSTFKLLLVSFVVIFVFMALVRGLIIWLAGDVDVERASGFWGNVYVLFLQMTDPGNMCQDIDSALGIKGTAIVAGLAGIVLLSALIAFLTTSLQQKIHELKRGHSKIIEDDHTVILGWNEQRVIEILRELVIANESEDDACIAILAPVDKEDMDDVLRLRVKDSKTTRIVTRSGSTASLANLDVVSVDSCKSVIVLASCSESGNAHEKAASDARVIQTVLAVASSDPREDDATIVAEIFSAEHRAIVERTFPRQVITIDTCEVLSKIMVQTSRSTGLSVVYNEILSFDGCELYFHQAEWGGRRFGEVVYHFPDGVPMGIRTAAGDLQLNPPADRVLAPDDELIILAEDDSTIDFRPRPVATARDLVINDRRVEQRIERELLLGWTQKTPIVLREYADYVRPGSRVDIMLRQADEDIRAIIHEVDVAIPQIDVRVIERDRLRTDDLMAVEPFTYDNIIILAEDDEERDVQQVDSENIITLLLLRDIFKDHPDESASTKLITEVLDSQNHALVAKAGVKDVIISNRLISMILAQISESADIKKVYDDIFEEDGSEIYLKPLDLYLDEIPAELSFADCIALAQQRGEICLGVKITAEEENVAANCGITLIPPKDRRLKLLPTDRLLVLAEDES